MNKGIKKLTIATAITAVLSGPASASLIISEYIEGSSNNKALELQNTSDSTVDLSAWEIQIYFNSSRSAGLTLNLDGSVSPGATYVIAQSSSDPAITSVADLTSSAGFFNGDDAITLLNGGVVVDSIGQIGFDPGSYWGDGDTRTQNRTLRRIAGTPADTNPDDAYDPAAVFQGFPQDSFDDLGQAGGNDGPVDPPSTDLTCGAAATLISGVQGSGISSPLENQTVVVEAIVTARFNGENGLGGYFIQEEQADQDNNPITSEGLFVYAPEASVSVGDRVRVAGTVLEYDGLTELGSVTATDNCGTSELPPSTLVQLPWDDANQPETLEGMRIRFAEPLIVNDLYDLARYGSMALASKRLFIPTNIATPGEEANRIATANALDRIILDDARNDQNPETIPYPAPELNASNTVRAGEEVHDLQGVLDYRFNEWRLQPTETPSFVQTNPRKASPGIEDRGNLVIAAFNVLNYFNGDGMGGGFPTARGADNPEELARQTDKLVSAIREMDADIIGLMEIENDGYGETSAIAQLTGALGDNWDYIDPGIEQLGGDAIAVGLIYRTDRVEAMGEAATLTGPDFDDLNRQPLAQTFRLPDGTDGVTVVVNHLKSKGCGEASGAESAYGDGQGCWNPARTRAAQAQAAWLANDATGTGEQDILILGDLNAYAKEDPITAFKNAGYTDLVDRFASEPAYSYVYYGEAGYLDHALANSSLDSKIVGTRIWHINADEPRIFDYNLEYQTPEQQAAYYAADAYRASDHDPILVALQLDETSTGSPDLNEDGRIDGRDLLRFVWAYIWGRADLPGYDINGDGLVGLKDFNAIVQAIRA